MTFEEQKELAKKYLAETDYAMLSDVAIDNQEFFISYRAHLRDIIYGVEKVDIVPDPPHPIWTEAE